MLGPELGLQVEGAVAKYFASEAGNAAADAAIQAHGGYGYTHEYEVEKIRRDVRITTIYEGTSEILQNIIGTHRWRMSVKTKGGSLGQGVGRIGLRGASLNPILRAPSASGCQAPPPSAVFSRFEVS